MGFWFEQIRKSNFKPKSTLFYMSSVKLVELVTTSFTSKTGFVNPDLDIDHTKVDKKIPFLHDTIPYLQI
jgi:hypothetical protein